MAKVSSRRAKGKPKNRPSSRQVVETARVKARGHVRALRDRGVVFDKTGRARTSDGRFLSSEALRARIHRLEAPKKSTQRQVAYAKRGDLRKVKIPFAALRERGVVFDKAGRARVAGKFISTRSLNQRIARLERVAPRPPRVKPEPTERDHLIVQSWFLLNRIGREIFERELTAQGKKLLERRQFEMRPVYEAAIEATRHLSGRKKDRALGEIADKYGLDVREVYRLRESPESMGVSMEISEVA